MPHCFVEILDSTTSKNISLILDNDIVNENVFSGVDLKIV